MCLILFAVRPNEHYRLVVAANRDEFYGRPASRANFWDDHRQVLAGRDLQAGGTWLGITKSARFAAVTNFRETPADPLPPRSRGELTSDFLTGQQSAEDYTAGLAAKAHEYRGFNLIVDDGRQCCYYSNQLVEPLALSPGFYGLSNQLLDCDWPKVNQGRDSLARLVNRSTSLTDKTDRLKDLLMDKGDGSPFSNSFIDTDEYGTCASTVLTISTTGTVRFTELGFAAGGRPETEVHYQFDV